MKKMILSVGIAGMLLSAAPARAQDAAAAQVSLHPADASVRADLYFRFTMGHVEEQQFEMTGRSEWAEQSIASYKSALKVAPDSTVIRERLAEIYEKSQRIRDAVAEAQAALEIDPDNLDAHRLLARIYVRTLGDITAGEVQKENLSKAVEQLRAILKVRSNDSYSALWLARLYRLENEHDEAEKVLRGVLNHEPDNGPALEQLSQLLIDEGRSEEAIELLTQAAGDSASPDIYGLLGDACSQGKDYTQAEAAYRKALEGDPDSADHLRGLAQALLAQDKYPQALEQYTKLSELEPGTPENYIRMAQLYRRLGKLDQAESSLLRAKQLEPGNLEVLFNEALLYEDQGRFNDALTVLNDAIGGVKSQSKKEDANPSALGTLYEQLGRVYQEQQNYPAAVLAFEQMAKLGAGSAKRAQMLLIETYRDSRDLDRAISETKKALDESPKDSSLVITLAMLYGEKTDTAEATKLLGGLLEGSDRDEEIYVDLAQVEERGRKYEDAEESAEKAVQMAHQPSEREAAWFMLGAVYERQKKFEQAEQQFRKVLEVNPGNAAVLNYYGYMLADRGVRLEEATAMIQRALQQEPNNGAYLDSLGWAYYKQNHLAEAEEYLRKAVDRDSHDPTILGHLGDVCMKLGQTDRAAELMERALAEWQRAVPADYEPDRVTELDAQLKTLKRRLAQKSAAETAKPR
jgi:tetratricopeptide (TPR) repeat protein